MGKRRIRRGVYTKAEPVSSGGLSCLQKGRKKRKGDPILPSAVHHKPPGGHPFWKETLPVENLARQPILRSCSHGRPWRTGPDRRSGIRCSGFLRKRWPGWGARAMTPPGGGWSPGLRNGKPRRLAPMSGSVELRRPGVRGPEACFESRIQHLFMRRSILLARCLFASSIWAFANFGSGQLKICEDVLLIPPQSCGLFDGPMDGLTERFPRHGSTGLADGRQHTMSPATRTTLPHPGHEENVRQHHQIQVPGPALGAG